MWTTVYVEGIISYKNSCIITAGLVVCHDPRIASVRRCSYEFIWTHIMSLIHCLHCGVSLVRAPASRACMAVRRGQPRSGVLHDDMMAPGQGASRGQDFIVISAAWRNDHVQQCSWSALYHSLNRRVSYGPRQHWRCDGLRTCRRDVAVTQRGLCGTAWDTSGTIVQAGRRFVPWRGRGWGGGVLLARWRLVGGARKD